MLELAQLAPLHQQLDTNYPENLRTVAEWLFVQLVEDEESVPTPDRLYKLATLALRQTERLSAEEGGRNFYLARACATGQACAIATCTSASTAATTTSWPASTI